MIYMNSSLSFKQARLQEGYKNPWAVEHFTKKTFFSPGRPC